MVGMLKTKRPAQRAARHLARSSTRSSSTTLTEQLRRDRRRLARGSAARQRRLRSSAAAPRRARPAAPWRRPQMGKQEALKQFTVDLTEQARKGKIDPIVGRDEEIRQIVDILMRRRQNNPILTGEAGVGKTAVVEGFAQRIARGDVPPPLQGRDAAHARRRPAAGRRQHEGRVREPPAPGDRRGAGLAQADHPVHRRGAHADRRRRRGRHRRRGQPAQAGAGARHAAHHRRHHLGRIQEAHREGPGADPPLPGRAGRRAERGQGHPDDARRGLRRWRSTTGCRCSTRRSRRRSSCRTATSRRASCPTRRSACSTPPAPAWPSASTPTPAEVEDCRKRIEALETELGIIGREKADRHRHRQARDRRPTKLLTAERARLAELEARWSRARRRWSTRSWRCAPSCATASSPVEGTGSKLEADAAAEAAGGRRPRPTPTAEAERAALLAQAEGSAGQADGAAGRDAADPAHASTTRPWPRWWPTGPASRSAAWSRTRSRPCCKLADTLEPARHRPAPRAGDDRQAHPDLARQARQPEQADRRVHAGRPLRRRQDRDRAGAGRGALRRRAERHHHQHERVPGGAHRLAR